MLYIFLNYVRFFTQIVSYLSHNLYFDFLTLVILTEVALNTCVASALSPWHDILNLGLCSASGSVLDTNVAGSFAGGINTIPKLLFMDLILTDYVHLEAGRKTNQLVLLVAIVAMHLLKYAMRRILVGIPVT